MHSRTDAARPTSTIARIREFFHGEETPFGIAVVRICLPLSLLVAMIPRWPRARELYSLDGATAPLWITFGWPDMLPILPGTMVVVLATLLIATLITSCLGWCTRASLVIAFVLYTYLSMLDSISTETKYSVIASHMLLLLSLSQCGAVWSVDAWLRKRRLTREGRCDDADPITPLWPRRLLQMLIGFIYLGAAITKMHTPAYFSSDQLINWMRSQLNHASPLGEYLSLFPALLVLVAYVTIVWEILFLFIAWRGCGRVIMLSLGVGFHIMTALTLGLTVFPMVCLSIYFAFLNEADYRKIAAFLGRRRTPAGGTAFPGVTDAVVATPTAAENRPARTGRFADGLPVPSFAVFAAVLGGLSVAAVEVEYRLDPYGKRRPEGPYALKELDPAYVGKLLAEPEQIRPGDVVDNLEAGTILVSGKLLDFRREFRQGELLIAQVTLNSPHEDMCLDCSLHDSDGHEIITQPRTVPREVLRQTYPFRLTDALAPGTYYLLLKCAGRDVMRRTITVTARSGRQAAN